MGWKRGRVMGGIEGEGYGEKSGRVLVGKRGRVMGGKGEGHE